MQLPQPKQITPRVQQRQLLQTTTLRGFEGGLDTTDDDLNLSFKYSTRLLNLNPREDGTLELRWGVNLFVTLPAAVIETVDYNNNIIAVLADGRIYKITRPGVATAIWNTAIAAALPGTPSAWHTTTFATFAKFNNSLIVANGIDKPVIIAPTFAATYLQDPATTSNLNVPVAKYVVSAKRYVLMAGDPLFPTRVHISARDASGVWYGDPAPNDGIHIDVGSALPAASVIRGLLPFRDTVLILFAEGIVICKLGIYDAAGNHTPDFNDSIEEYGGVSHRTAVTYGDDGILLDLVGVPSVRRNVFNGSVTPDRVSQLIANDIIAAVNPLSSSTLDERTFTIYNQKEQQFLMFLPNANTIGTTTSNKVFVYNDFTSSKAKKWAEFDFGALVFTCGCRTLQGDVVFGDAAGHIWRYGSTETPILNDNSADIAFDWELPWLDFGARAANKNSKYISFDARGTGEFTCRMYVDNFVSQQVVASDGVTINTVDTPQLSTEFSGGDQQGFGAGPQPFGGGRNSRFNKLLAWPSKFQVAKLRLSGSTSERLTFISITMHFQKGSIRR